MNLSDYKNVSRETIEKQLSKSDKYVLGKLNTLIKSTDKHLGKYDFQHSVEDLYDFFWHEFCDKTIEDCKVRIRDNAKDKLAAQFTLDTVLRTSLKLLHPFMPFVTESIWENLGEQTPLIISEWPK
jgi:valyl-tRNA synthetase